jgi:cytochrome c oxidase subunit 3
MDFIHELSRKPWESEEGNVAEIHSGKAYHLTAEKMGLRIFLAVVTVLFSLTVIVYGDRMVLSDWRPIPEPWLLWLNTVLLIIASLAFERTVINARAGQMERVKTALYAAGIATFAFLIGQLWVVEQLESRGYFSNASPALAFFCLLTAMHALHLLGGLVAWGRTVARMRRGYQAAQLLPSVELCAVYWHYLLALWVVLFGLLLLT